MSEDEQRRPDTNPDVSNPAAGSPEDAAVEAASEAAEAALDEIPDQDSEALSQAMDGAVGALSVAASAGSSGAGEAVVDQAIGTATGAGAISSALDNADVPGSAAIAQAIGQAAQITQSAVRHASEREPSEPAHEEGSGSDQQDFHFDVPSSASGPSGGDGEQAQVLFEPESQTDVVWDVARLELEEGLNQPFEARVELRTDQMDAEPSRLLGTSATVLVERGDLRQRCPGLVVKVVEGTATGDYLSVRVTLAPALGLLGQRRDTRVFQLMTATEILQSSRPKKPSSLTAPRSVRPARNTTMMTGR